MHSLSPTNKKPIIALPVIWGLIFFCTLNSCCSKKDCTGSDEIYEIRFSNFSQEDLDTIYVISYVKNSGFSIMVDSFSTRADLNVDFFSAYTHNRINPDYDYKIKIVSTGSEFNLTDFEIEKKGCNSCFPYRPESDFYNRLASYSVNGQKQFVDQIIIYK